MERELEMLATGSAKTHPLPRVSLIRTLKATLAYLRARRIYLRGGFPAAHAYLCSLQESFSPYQFDESVNMKHFVRTRLASHLRTAGKIVGESYSCLPSSVAMTAGLISYGVQAQVVIGKARYIDGLPFHAWTDLNGVPVFEDELLPRKHWIVLRTPEW